MSEIVKAKILDICAFTGILKSRAPRFPRLVVSVDKHRIIGCGFPIVTETLECFFQIWMKRNGPRFTILGVSGLNSDRSIRCFRLDRIIGV